MAAPTFVAASAGATDAGGAWTFTTLTGMTTGNIVIVQILQDGTTNGAVTFTSDSQVNNLAGSAGWTTIPGPNGDSSWPIGSAATGRQFLLIGRVNGTQPQIGGGNSTSEDLYIRMYEFTNVSTGTTLATVIENSTAGNATNGAATSTTCSDTAVTTLGPDRLALNFVGLSDDAMGLTTFVGATGGTWALPTDPYEESSGTDATIALMVAYPAGVYSPRSAGHTSFGTATSFERYAESFVAGDTAMTHVDICVNKLNNPSDNFVMEIQTDSSGSPSESVVASTSILGSSLPTGGTSTLTSYALSASLTQGNTYWLVLSRDGALSDTDRYSVNASSSDVWPGGAVKTYDAGAWSSLAADVFFAIRNQNSTGKTIDGGSDAITSIGWGVVGFALIGTTVAASPLLLSQGFVNFNDPGVL